MLTAQLDSLPPKPDPYRLVNDFAKLLWYYEADEIEHKLQAFEDNTSNQIAVVTVHGTKGIAIADYAVALGRKWGIGQQNKNNGVLVVISVDDRMANISPGYGLEGALPDIRCSEIINNILIPYFKEEKYYEGINSAVDVIINATKGEYKPVHAPKKKHNYKWLIILSLIIGVNAILISFHYLRNWLLYKFTGKKQKRKAYEYTPAQNEESKDTETGTGNDTTEYERGFGGGSFGGGGASGKW